MIPFRSGEDRGGRWGEGRRRSGDASGSGTAANNGSDADLASSDTLTEEDIGRKTPESTCDEKEPGADAIDEMIIGAMASLSGSVSHGDIARWIFANYHVHRPNFLFKLRQRLNANVQKGIINVQRRYWLNDNPPTRGQETGKRGSSASSFDSISNQYRKTINPLDENAGMELYSEDESMENDNSSDWRLSQ